MRQDELNNSEHAMTEVEEPGGQQVAVTQHFAFRIVGTGTYRGEIFNLYTRTWEAVYYDLEEGQSRPEKPRRRTGRQKS